MSEFYFKAGGRTTSPQLSALAPAAATKHSSRPPSPSPKDLPFPPISRILSHIIPKRPPDPPPPPNFPRISRILSCSLVSSRTSPQNVHTTCRPPHLPRISRILSCPLARLPQHVHPTPAPFPKTKLLALPFAFCYTANCRDWPQETTGWRYYFSYAARGAGRRSFPTFSEP